MVHVEGGNRRTGSDQGLTQGEPMCDLHREDRCGPYNGGTDRTCREGETFNDTCRQGRTDASCLQERSDNKTAGRKPHVKTAGKPTLRQQDCKPLTKTAGLSNH